jgi:hypothetical protein
MRRSVVVVLAVLAILGFLAPPTYAQAPAPKVTITGLVDFVTTAYKNWSQSNGQGNPPGQADVTNSKEKGWYSRERGVFTLTGEVGKVKGVWAIELDFTNGAGNFNASSQPGSLTTVGVAAGGTSANFDLDTDVQGAVETKWLYLEAPITGPGSLMPFIPVASIGRMGGQPFRGHDYKFGILASGDFPGVTLETTWAPNVRSTVTFVQIGEALDRFIAPNQKDQFALLASLEMDVIKGLTIKPTYAYAYYDGGNCGTNNLGTSSFGGYNPNFNCPGVTAGSVAAPGLVGRDITRHYIGADVRWTLGPITIQPTFIYLVGKQEITNRAGVVNDVDIRSFIADTIIGFRTGPLNIEGRIMYTPGEAANNDNQNGGGGTIRRYDPINSGFAYMSGWTEIWTGNIDYASSFLVNRTGLTLRESPSYDKYGRIFAALAADYSLTPALTFRALTNVSWTDTRVDTKGTFVNGIIPSGICTGGNANATAGGGCGIAGNPFQGGKERYLGNEWVLGLTYRFAPNVTFDFAAAALITGDALNIQRNPSVPQSSACATDGVPTCQSRNVYKGSARLRVTF